MPMGIIVLVGSTQVASVHNFVNGVPCICSQDGEVASNVGTSGASITAVGTLHDAWVIVLVGGTGGVTDVILTINGVALLSLSDD